MNLVLEAVKAPFLMLWKTFWALTLGFTLSSVVQVLVPSQLVTRYFGRASFASVALATFFGAVSSSCSYAAASTARSAFRKGAHLIPALAFMFASTNLVVELGAVLWIFLGPRFVLAEIIGAFVLIALMSLLVALTYPKRLMEKARSRVEEEGATGGASSHDCCHPPGPEHSAVGPSEAPVPAARTTRLAQIFFRETGMVWKEIVFGFITAGLLMVLVPAPAWKALFLQTGPAPLRLVENVVVGVLIAILSFVCSVGNIPLAAVLWSGGISFGGVIAFIYADLVTIPLLLVYRKYYGAGAAAYITAILLASMVGAGILVDLLFGVLHGQPPGPRPPLEPMLESGFDWQTLLLNLLALTVIAFFWFKRRSAEPVDAADPASCH